MKVYDLIGIGFGPAAISSVAYLEENFEHEFKENVLFLEKRSNSNWQGNFILPHSRIYHNHLRDLATPTNPLTKFSFVNYLVKNDLLYLFSQLDNIVFRRDWVNYINWVANQLKEYVNYNSDVKSIDYDEKLELLIIKTSKESYYSKNLLLSHGLKPKIPNDFKKIISNRCFHTCDFMKNIKDLEKTNKYKFLIVGDGQSAAESIIYLRKNFLNSVIEVSTRDLGFKIKETGHFSNFIYFPEETDTFYSLSKELREEYLQKNYNKDYGTVGINTSRELFEMYYHDKISGIDIINYHFRTSINILSHDNKYNVLIKSIYNDSFCQDEFDIIILATGYEEEVFPNLIKPLKKYIDFDGDDYRISTNYRVQTSENFKPNIYLSGLSEKKFGMGDTQSFSLMAVKGKKIIDDFVSKTKNKVNIYDEKFSNS